VVDWEAVERLRSKGWDWERIAGDPKVEFTPDAGVEQPGRALRSLYYQRRSKQSRQGGSSGSGGSGKGAASTASKWNLARIGLILAPLFGIWFLLAYVFPSPVGAYIAAIPILLLLLAISGVILGFGLLRSANKWSPTYRNSLIVGVVLGFVIAGILGLTVIAAGCPQLTSGTTSQPGGWEKANNALWAVSNAPVFFFYGSVACPYCASSSWSVDQMLGEFGPVTGVQYTTSSPTDVYPNTPEIILSGLSLQSQYVALNVVESLDNSQITLPATPSCVEQAYVSTYDSSGIPFIVLGGIYIHSGGLVPNPGVMQGLSATQVQQQVSSQSGAVYDQTSPQAFWMMAYMVKLNNGQPASVASIPQVAADLAQIP
jgi:hypothetical protein